MKQLAQVPKLTYYYKEILTAFLISRNNKEILFLAKSFKKMLAGPEKNSKMFRKQINEKVTKFLVLTVAFLFFIYLVLLRKKYE
jgi:hypothetical protein